MASIRSSGWQMFLKIGVLKSFETCNFIKGRLQHKYFPVNIAKFLRTASPAEHLRRLAVSVQFRLFLAKVPISSEYSGTVYIR